MEETLDFPFFFSRKRRRNPNPQQYTVGMLFWASFSALKAFPPCRRLPECVTHANRTEIGTWELHMHDHWNIQPPWWTKHYPWLIEVAPGKGHSFSGTGTMARKWLKDTKNSDAFLTFLNSTTLNRLIKRRLRLIGPLLVPSNSAYLDYTLSWSCNLLLPVLFAL